MSERNGSVCKARVRDGCGAVKLERENGNDERGLRVEDDRNGERCWTRYRACVRVARHTPGNMRCA